MYVCVFINIILLFYSFIFLQLISFVMIVISNFL